MKYVDPSGNRKTSTYYEIEKMLSAAMKGDNSYKSSLNKVYTKVYGDKGAKFANLYAQLTQTSGAFINSPANAKLAKGQLLTAYENGQDRNDVQVAWASVARGYLSGRVNSALGINSVTGLFNKMPEFTGSTREKLLSSVRNGDLRNIVNELYRPGAKVGDGGTAAILTKEFYEGSSTHLQKAQQRLKKINDLAKSGKLGLNDLDIVDALRNDLEKAIRLFN